jgi:hypothetical protein
MGEFLYHTTLLIEEESVPYIVTNENGLLLFKPEQLPRQDIESPIFWVKRENDSWQPLNIKDDSLTRQVIEDVNRHDLD